LRPATRTFRVAIVPVERKSVAVSADGNRFSQTGSYELESVPQEQPFVIRVDAKGYAPFASEPLTQFEGKLEVEVELQPEE